MAFTELQQSALGNMIREKVLLLLLELSLHKTYIIYYSGE